MANPNKPNTSIDYNTVPPDIVRARDPESYLRDFYNTFDKGRERSFDTVKKFLNGPYFSGEESLLQELYKVRPSISFNDIKDEGINLALLTDLSWQWEFNSRLQKINSVGIKRAFMQVIHNKVLAKIGTGAPYNDFKTECPLPTRNPINVIAYFQKVEGYLKGKESEKNAKKAIDILKDIVITNEDLNSRLAGGQRIPGSISLNDSRVPTETREAFDSLLSFEIGKAADRVVGVAQEIAKSLEGITTNTFPAINTLISENEELQYNEDKLKENYPTYESELHTINNDNTLSDLQKNEKILEIKWKYYLEYLKKQNKTIGNILETLYKNNFDYSKLPNAELKIYLDKIADIRFNSLFNEGLSPLLKLDIGNIDEFKAFFKSLADPDPSAAKITIRDVSLPGFTPHGSVVHNIDIPVTKRIVGGDNSRLNNIEYFGGKMSKESQDALPIEFTIQKSDIDNLKITSEDKINLLSLLSRFDRGDKYVIDGRDVGILIYLYYIINSKTPITEIPLEEQKKIEDLFGSVKHIDDNNIKKPYFTPAEFKKNIEKVGGVFKTGGQLWIPSYKSELPGGGYGWTYLNIDDIDNTKGTFTGSLHGGELPLGGNGEGKSTVLDMNDTFINEFLKKASKKDGKYYLLPNPNGVDFNTYVKNLNKSGMNDLNFPPSGVTWDEKNNKFMQKVPVKNSEGITEGVKDVEVKYFRAKDDVDSSYKISYDSSKNKFSVTSEFIGDVGGKNGNSEEDHLRYNRDMDWNNFLIFMNEKGLVPQTEQEAAEVIRKVKEETPPKIVNGRAFKLNWYSLSNIKNGFKNIFGAITKRVKEYDDRQTQRFQDTIESGILDFIIEKGIPLPPSISYAIGKRRQEIHNEMTNKAWPEIQKYYDDLIKDKNFADTFVGNPQPPHSTELWGNSYKGFLESLYEKSKNLTNLNSEDTYKAAAFLLANIEKGNHPYRGLGKYENKGFWVQLLLGKAHHDIYISDRKKCYNALLKAGKNKDQIQDSMSKSELTYIINNINGTNGDAPYFGSHEKSGNNGETAKYIPNPSKIRLGTEFADKLTTFNEDGFTKDSVQKEYDSIKHYSFDQAREDFKSKLKSCRYKAAFANLRKMMDLSKTNEQMAEMKKCFLICMLSGAIDIYGGKKLRNEVYQWGKTLTFLPGMLAKNTGHAEQVVEFLSGLDPDFSRKVPSYFRKSDMVEGNLQISELIEQVESWWCGDNKDENIKNQKSVDTHNKLHNYTKEFRYKTFPLNSTLDLLQKSLKDSSRENIKNDILSNSFIANSGGILSDANVVRNRMTIDHGNFTGSDSDEVADKESFWAGIADSVRKLDATNVNDLKLLLEQYLSRFDITNKKETYRWIKTALSYKDKVPLLVEYPNDDGTFANMGVVGEREIKTVLWYTFKGNVMQGKFYGQRIPPQMHSTLDAFQEKFEEAFSKGMFEKDEVMGKVFEDIFDRENVHPLCLGSWHRYNETVTGRQNVNVDEKNDKNATKKIFESGRFINKDIAEMERKLRGTHLYNEIETVTINFDDTNNPQDQAKNTPV